VCLDGNFEQKRCWHCGCGDQAVPKPETYFLPHQEVQDVRRYTEGMRGGPAAAPNASDLIEAGLSMPNYVYDGCGHRFTAADESKAKAGASVFDDTGLMALTCRHDRVLFMVTLKDPGERQYNALALLKALFDGLPSYWRVGALYDIGCQLHHSIAKVRAQTSSANRAQQSAEPPLF
jgi:hypothetical protein